MFTDRKSCYKLPPTTIRDKLISQETRRNKALEDQKRVGLETICPSFTSFFDQILHSAEHRGLTLPGNLIFFRDSILVDQTMKTMEKMNPQSP